MYHFGQSSKFNKLLSPKIWKNTWDPHGSRTVEVQGIILTLSSQNYDLLDLPHCISFNIEGIYHLIPKLTSNPQKWPWPWTHLEVSEKWKSSFKKSFFSFINWNFILRRFRKFLISCFLRNSKIPNGLGKTAVLQNQQSFIFERRKFFIRFRFEQLKNFKNSSIWCCTLYITWKKISWAF